MTPLEERIGRVLAGRVRASAARPGLTLLVAGLLCAASLGWAVGHLGVVSDTDELFDASLPFRQLRKEVEGALPQRSDTLLVVVDGPSAIAAEDAARELAARAEASRELVVSAFVPGAGPFFERNGLLYLSLDELETLADRLASAQPFLAEVARDPSLRGVLGQLERGIEVGRGRRAGGVALDTALAGVAGAVRDAERLEPHPESFGSLVLGDHGRGGGDTRRYVIVKPRIDYGDFAPGAATLERLREIGHELRFEDRGIRARITGDLALKAEEFSAVRGQAAAAGVASFLLVSSILWIALGSGRLILSSIATLLVGLVWTVGFAAAAVGHLNVISVAFAVLFIGLGVDFCIHFTMRYQELRLAGEGHLQALDETARGVGGSLALCAATTAIGFYAFVPTGYKGVAELGVISGTGMLISLAASLTVLPALLSLGDAERLPRRPRGGGFDLPRWPLRWPRLVVAGSAVLTGLALLEAHALHFDANPLHVRDPGIESVQTFEELIDGGDLNPWNIEVLAPDTPAAAALAGRIAELPSVAEARTLSSYVPGQQAEKLAVIADMSLFLELPDAGRLPPPTPAQEATALREFRDSLRSLEAEAEMPLSAAATSLGADLDRFLAHFADDEDAVEALRVGLVDALLERLERLGTALRAGPVGVADLPRGLRERMVAPDGRSLVEVVPRESLADDAALHRFVEEVRSVTPRATGTSVYMFESGRAIVASLRQAVVTALLLVSALLWLLWRNTRDAALVLTPLVMAGLLTAAFCVVVGLSINFADVIVVPLLLGIGVDSGIHLVHRQRHHQAGTEALLETSTPRAILWSALTTIGSFGSLAFASHLGLASLGQLLTAGVTLTLACNLLTLPALLVLTEPREAANGASRARAAAGRS